MLIDNFEPWLVANAIALMLILVAIWWNKTAAYAWGVLFLAAGIFNGYMAIGDPSSYQYYATTAIGWYKQFISGFFAEHTTVIVLIISFGQLLIGAGLFGTNALYRTALIGGMIFLVAIMPLGLGAAFPATLLMALSLFILYYKVRNKIVVEVE